jgi:hypothetical protein
VSLGEDSKELQLSEDKPDQSSVVDTTGAKSGAGETEFSTAKASRRRLKSNVNDDESSEDDGISNLPSVEPSTVSKIRKQRRIIDDLDPDEE